MKKSELIEILAEYPDDMEILVDGYEDGFEKPTVFVTRFVRKNRGGDYAGEYSKGGPNDELAAVISRFD